jgi:hypothetical protein
MSESIETAKISVAKPQVLDLQPENQKRNYEGFEVIELAQNRSFVLPILNFRYPYQQGIH